MHEQIFLEGNGLAILVEINDMTYLSVQILIILCFYDFLTTMRLKSSAIRQIAY